MVIVLGAALPDPHQPETILVLVGLGALVRTAIGRIRRVCRERTREIAENWGFVGGMIGTALYVAALVATIAAAIRWRIGELRTMIATFALIAGLAGRFALKERRGKKGRGDRRSRQPRKGGGTMPTPDTVHYRDARGVEHAVVMRKHHGTWQVVDLSVRDSRMIETLTGWTRGDPRPRRSRASTCARSEPRARGQQPPAARKRDGRIALSDTAGGR
jgi:hypothetical protein